MIIAKEVTVLTINTLDALIANFATGIISLDELWEAIEGAGDAVERRIALMDDALTIHRIGRSLPRHEDAEDAAYFRDNLLNPSPIPVFPESLDNRIPNTDVEPGI